MEQGRQLIFTLTLKTKDGCWPAARYHAELAVDEEYDTLAPDAADLDDAQLSNLTGVVAAQP